MNNPQKREQVPFDVAGVINNLNAHFVLDDVVQRSGRHCSGDVENTKSVDILQISSRLLRGEVCGISLDGL